MTSSSDARDQRIDELFAQFSARPSAQAVFEELEQELRAAERWVHLAGAYEVRLATLADPAARAEQLLRLGCVLEDQLAAPRAALRRFKEARALDPRRPELLARLRQLLARQGDRMAALQIADVEEQLDLAAPARALLMFETAELWGALGEQAELQRRLEEALRLDPSLAGARRRLAELSPPEPEQAARTTPAAATPPPLPAQPPLAPMPPPVPSSAPLAPSRETVASIPPRPALPEESDPASQLGIAASLEPEPPAEPEPESPEEQSRRIAASEPERARERLRAQPELGDASLALLLDLERAAGDWNGAHEVARRLAARLREPSARAELARQMAEELAAHAAQREAALEWAESAARDAPQDARVHQLRARLYREGAQRERLVDALDALERIEGVDAARALELAALHERAGRTADAAAALQRVLSAHPEDGDAAQMLDRCLARLGRHAERAELLARRCAAAGPGGERSALERMRGDVHAELGDVEAAASAYRAALAASPSEEAAAQGLLALASEHGIGREVADALAGAATRIGSGAMAARRWCEVATLRKGEPTSDAARAAYVQALEAEPRCEDALLGLRALHGERDDVAAHRAACEAELRVHPGVERSIELLRELIGAGRASGDLAAARQAALRWADLEASPEPLRELASLAREGRSIDEERQALEGLEATLAAGSAQALCRTRLGELAELEGGEHADERAAHWYRASLEAEPSPDVRARLLALYRRGGQLPELAAQLRSELAARAAAAPDERLPLQLELATTLRELGDPREATRTLLEAFRRDPGSSAIGPLLESVLHETDDVETLASVLEARLTCVSDVEQHRGTAARLAALYLDRLGRPRDAVTALRDCVEAQRDEEPERLYDRALLAGGDVNAQIQWWTGRERRMEGAPRAELLLLLAAAQERAGKLPEAIESLERAELVLPERQLDAARRPLYALARAVSDPERQLEVLERLGRSARTAAARAAFVLERARILIEDLDRAADGAAELERMPSSVPLRPHELRVMCTLSRRAPDRARYAGALRALCEASGDPGERAALTLELAELHLKGPEPLRDPARGEALLRGLLDDPAVHEPAFRMLEQTLAQSGRTRERADLLHQVLARPQLAAAARAQLTLQLGAALLEIGEAPAAAHALSQERERGADRPELDALLCDALERTGDLRGCEAIFRERALHSRGAERTRWLRRWLAALEAAHADAAPRLEVVERLLATVGRDRDLALCRIELLRQTDQLDALAHALEDLLATDADLNRIQRDELARELLRLYEGPLRQPSHALLLIERELARRPELRERAAELAGELGNREREAVHLAALLEQTARDDAARIRWNRRLALALAELGRGEEAEPRLREALVHTPRDRDVLRALERGVRGARAPARLLELLDARYPVEAQSARTALAREAFGLAEQLCDSATALRWMRRWQGLETPTLDSARRWLGLERALGDPAGVRCALRALRDATPDGVARAELLAEEAGLEEARGALAAAREAYEQACALAPQRAVPWLQELEQIAARRGQTEERLALLERLAQHPEISVSEQVRCREERIALLARRPDARELATRELRALLDDSPDRDRSTRMARLRMLLDLYADLGHAAEWCGVAEQLLPLATPSDAETLERELARRWETLGAHARAIPLWQRVLQRAPHDLEALEALGRMLDRPGSEEARARVLEARAEAAPRGDGSDWLEVAALRWERLADPRALEDVERALLRDPSSTAAHALRVELCAQLQHADAEEESLRALLAAEPEHGDLASRWLRLAEILLARGAPEAEVGAAAQSALERSAAGAPLRAALARIFARIGAWSSVVELLRERAAGPEGRDADAALRELARIHWEQLEQPGETCRALEDLAGRGELDAADYERWSAALAALGRGPEALERRQRGLTALGERACARDWRELARDWLAAEEPPKAREAHARALALDPRDREALEARVALDEQLGDTSAQLEGLLRLAELRQDPLDAAEDLARAARCALRAPETRERAASLFETALARDESCLPALLGSAALAEQTGQWSIAERRHAHAAQLLSGLDGVSAELVRAASGAARAALEQDRRAAAAHYLDQALAAGTDDPSALADLLELSLLLGQPERARECLETQLARPELTSEQRTFTRVLLAETCEQLGDLDAAARTLEDESEDSEVLGYARERVVDLLERLGASDRALAQLESWSKTVRAEYQPALDVRAARVEVSAGRHAQARARLEASTARHPARGTAWIELAALVAHEEGASAGLDVVERALASVQGAAARASLLWSRARWLAEAGRFDAALASAEQVLDLDLANLEAARLLALHLDRARNPGQNIARIEECLRETPASGPVAAEIWHAVGRCYAEQFGDRVRAREAQRQALQENPLHERAREELADLCPAEGSDAAEAVRLHRTLLEQQPARGNSWRALEQISRTQRRDRALRTCRAVQAALALEPSTTSDLLGPQRGLLVRTGPSDTRIAAATELLLALEELGMLPPPEASNGASLPIESAALRGALAKLCGIGCQLSDAQLQRALSLGSEETEAQLNEVSRLRRRRLRKAQREHQTAGGAELDPATWRAALLAQAASVAVSAGELSISDALRALLRGWPGSSQLQTHSPETYPAALAGCAPTRDLMWRVADATLATLPS